MARATNARTAAARAGAVEERKTGESTPTMSALSSGSGVAARLAPVKPKTRGFLHIVRHGGGPHAIYIVTYHRLDHDGPSATENHSEHKEHGSVHSTSFGAGGTSAPAKPVLAEGAHALIELL